jgi:hypothetical protein
LKFEIGNLIVQREPEPELDKNKGSNPEGKPSLPEQLWVLLLIQREGDTIDKVCIKNIDCEYGSKRNVS